MSGGNSQNGEFKSHFSYDIPGMISKDDGIEFINYSVPYAIIPISFYTINENNCRLDLNTSTYGDFSVNFEFGNFNANSFMTQFKSLLSQYGFTISLDVVNNKYTISNTTEAFTILGTSSIDYIMGFNDTAVSSLVNGVNKLTMVRPCNFLSLPRICLRCPELANGSTIVGNNQNDVILSIPNNTRPNGQTIFENSIKHHLSVDSLDGLTIRITDDDGRCLNFNGLSSFFIIQFDIYRKNFVKPPTFKELKNIGNNNLEMRVKNYV